MMTIYRVARLIHHVRKECCESYTDMFLQRVLKVPIKPRIDRKCASTSDAVHHKTQRWHSFVRRWEWNVPVGVGVSLLAILQWRYLKKHPYTTQTIDAYEPVNNYMMKFYCCLPLRIASRIWGWIASVELPVSLRPALYGFYARTFHANLDEIDLDLAEFPSLVDFFVRPLKCNARPISEATNIISPADGTVLHFGPVTSCKVEQVKGVTYNLRHFLGDVVPTASGQLQTYTKEEDDAYVKSLLKDPTNQLYQLIVYLAPGDYHRFHSPTDWDIELRRHFQGKLLSVNPKIAKRLPDLFSLNERVVYIGKWANGFMAYTAVGATNVGSIKVYCDTELHTNVIMWPEAKHWKDASFGCTRICKGELFGEFRMGSTIVLLFEAPKDFKFCVKIGQAIKVGQALTDCNVTSEENRQKDSL